MVKPTFETSDGAVELYLGDCRDVLPMLQGVDAIVTDPPYGISYCHGGGLRGIKSAVGQTLHANARGCEPIHGDDEPFDPSHLLPFDTVLMFGADHFSERLPAGGYWIAWDKSVGLGPADDFADCEFAWTNRKVKRNVFRFLWKGLACVKAGEDNGRRWHPTQKPIALMHYCIEQVTEAGETVCDPYFGSGTTGVACVRLRRKFIGIEKEEKYFDIAVRRITAELNRAPLFEPAPVIQSTMFVE